MSDPEIRQQTASEPLTLAEEHEMQQSWHLDDDKLTFIITVGKDLVGDVNLFLSVDEDDDKPRGECEIMIARKDYRRKGVAREALQMLLFYASKHLDLPPSRFFCRISTSNTPSIALFESLGFTRYKEVAVFQETELRHQSEHFDWPAGGAEESYN